MGENIEMDLREVEWGRDWIDLAKDRYRWRDVVNAVMNFQVSENGGIYWVAEKLLALQEGLSSIELID